MCALPEKPKEILTRIGLYAAYVFLMLSVLRIASHAGDGFLSVQQQEMVYYVLQIFVILGFFAYAFVRERHRIHMERGLRIGILAAFFVCVTAMLFGKSSPVYMATAFLAATCLGYLGGAVYERMGEFAGAGGRVAAVGSVGYAAGIALQYLLQFWRGRSRLLPAAMLLAFCLLAWRLSGKAERPTEAAEAPARRDAPPLLGDRREGRYVPLAALCIALAALLNAVLVGSAGAYRLNMCLFYAALAATVSYYNLVFWRLAPGTKRPALWAGMGRVIDSASVLLGALLRIGTLPSAAVMAVNVAGLAALIVLMAVNGDFVFAAPEAPAVPAPDAETRLAAMASRYGLTPKETALLRELVLTEDKQTVIGERMDLKVKTIQKYVTQIYRKTGATTRSGLTELYHNTMAGI